MRLHEKHRPPTLDGIVGQSLGTIRALALEPRPACVLLEGPTGSGKTTTAFALARAYGAWDDPLMNGPIVVTGRQFNAERVDRLFGPDTPFCYCRRGFHVVIIEELAYMHPSVQEECKSLFEQAIAEYKLLIVATSNSTAKIDPVLIQRFWPRINFDGGPCFRTASLDRLGHIWKAETGCEELPQGWLHWGTLSDGGWSMRQAIDRLESAISIRGVHREPAAA